MKCSGMRGYGTHRNISSRLKHTLPHFTTPPTENEAECLVGLIGFWRQHVPFQGILLLLRYWWHGLSVALNRNGSAKGPAAWATWHSKPYHHIYTHTVGKMQGKVYRNPSWNQYVDPQCSDTRQCHLHWRIIYAFQKSAPVCCYSPEKKKHTTQGINHPEFPTLGWGLSEPWSWWQPRIIWVVHLGSNISSTQGNKWAAQAQRLRFFYYLSLLHHSSPLAHPCGHMDMFPYDQLTEKRKNQPWFTDELPWYVDANWKWTALRYSPRGGLNRQW